MDTNLQRVADEMAIRQALARGVRGADRLDRSLLESLYWADAYDYHGSFQGPAAEFIDWAIPHNAVERSTTHFLGQSLIVFDGDEAGVETYWTAYHMRDLEAGSRLKVYSGRYVDLFQKRGGEWRVKRREVISDFRYETEAEPREVQGMRKLGAHSMADPSYDLLGTPRFTPREQGFA